MIDKAVAKKMKLSPDAKRVFDRLREFRDENLAADWCDVCREPIRECSCGELHDTLAKIAKAKKE